MAIEFQSNCGQNPVELWASAMRPLVLAKRLDSGSLLVGLRVRSDTVGLRSESGETAAANATATGCHNSTAIQSDSDRNSTAVLSERRRRRPQRVQGLSYLRRCMTASDHERQMHTVMQITTPG